MEKSYKFWKKLFFILKMRMDFKNKKIHKMVKIQNFYKVVKIIKPFYYFFINNSIIKLLLNWYILKYHPTNSKLIVTNHSTNSNLIVSLLLNYYIFKYHKL